MPLHPTIQAALLEAANAPPYQTLPISEARARVRLTYSRSAPPTAVAQAQNLRVPRSTGDIPVRIYTPFGEGPFGVLMFFHGSGFAMLDLDTHDETCRRLCAGAECIVCSVDYRLAPEHPFPAGPDDCMLATQWMAEHAARFSGDRARMGVCGDSAGGCLAAVTAMRMRDGGSEPPLRAQVLIYPVTDHYASDHASYCEFSTGVGITAEAMRWYWDMYLQGEKATDDPNAAPLRMSTMAGLPPAYIVVAEYDVLRDEGEAFARRLTGDAVPAELVRALGMNHGFLRFDGIVPEATTPMDNVCRWLRSRLGTSGAGWSSPSRPETPLT
jgi:acetyl esterase